MINQDISTFEFFQKFIQDKCPNANPLLIVIRGSHAYGTSIPTSDIDYAGVYIQQQDDLFGFKYKEQINDEKNDTVFYEIKRFLELLASNNPTILELLNTPDDCVIYKHPLFEEVIKQRNNFITKTCANSFGGYAVQQIKKARGQNKKQNYEKEQITRKDVLDFCFVIEGEKSIAWKKYNEEYKYDLKFIGAVSIPNARDMYALFYDRVGYILKSNVFNDNEEYRERLKLKPINNINKDSKPLGYRGLVKVNEDDDSTESNALRLSSIPKGQQHFALLYYNKDGYSQHCKEYNSYQEWLLNRNEARWTEVKGHDQKLDGKNMLHCQRLLDMAKEIAEGKGVIVRRPNADELLKIRRGEVDLTTLLEEAEKKIKDIEILFENSNLPTRIDSNLMNNLLVTIRKNFYTI